MSNFKYQVFKKYMLERYGCTDYIECFLKAPDSILWYVGTYTKELKNER